MLVTKTGWISSERGDDDAVRGFPVSELRTLRRGRDWSPVRRVQGRLSMIFGDEDQTGQVDPATVPPTDSTLNVGRVPARPDSPPPVFHPLEYRNVVAKWPVEWRERWGRRANGLEETGLSWRDAETQAFIEIWKQIRNETSSHEPEAAPNLASSGAERN
jgi:hypothetical protein